jgi:hypothetical protein
MQPMTLVTAHALWMIVAVAIGTYSGYLGLLRATQNEKGHTPLPGRFKMRPHINTGTIYYLMLFAGIAFGWVMHEFLLPGPMLLGGVGTLHLVLGLTIGGLLARGPLPKERLWPRLHMIVNFTACTLVAVQIAVAAYYVWFRSYE